MRACVNFFQCARVRSSSGCDAGGQHRFRVADNVRILLATDHREGRFTRLHREHRVGGRLLLHLHLARPHHLVPLGHVGEVVHENRDAGGKLQQHSARRALRGVAGAVLHHLGAIVEMEVKTKRGVGLNAGARRSAIARPRSPASRPPFLHPDRYRDARWQRRTRGWSGPRVGVGSLQANGQRGGRNVRRSENLNNVRTLLVGNHLAIAKRSGCCRRRGRRFSKSAGAAPREIIGRPRLRARWPTQQARQAEEQEAKDSRGGNMHRFQECLGKRGSLALNSAGYNAQGKDLPQRHREHREKQFLLYLIITMAHRSLIWRSSP